MTYRDFYDHVLTELNKVEAPTLLLEDFNYFANKSVQQYINQVYNRFDTSQQSSDDLRVLQKSDVLDVINDKESKILIPGESGFYVCTLPEDYFHILNCVVIFNKKKLDTNNKCNNNDSNNREYNMARRLTADQFPSIIRNAYFKPSYKCPYFYINNTNNEGGAYPIKMEIRCGNTNVYEPTSVQIDYLRKPEQMSLTWDEINIAEDTTKEMEFPEYVCYEIINECVKLILENSSDVRLQTNYPINKTIGNVTSSDSK